MGNSQSAHKISAQDRAILDMKNQRDALRKYQKRITAITTRETEVARLCLARGDKPKALLALRRKKYQESLLSKTDAQLEQLEKLTSSVEFALVQKDVVYGLQRGTEVLKTIHKEMGGLEAVEKLMGESEEERAFQQVRCGRTEVYFQKIGGYYKPEFFQDLWHSIDLEQQLGRRMLIAHLWKQEVSEALAGQMSNQDEDEVEDELEALEREFESVKLPDAPRKTIIGEDTLPNAPISEVGGEEERLQKQRERAKARRVALEA